MELDPSQRAAVDLIASAPFAVITGGPGTGKTTCLATALTEISRQGEHVALAAPTGKAARRMSEATRRPASTIHKLLCWSRGKFTRNRDNPLEADVVIVDEASMLDVELAADLVRATRKNARLVFIGDANQLPSIGPGRVLADLVESSKVPVARLTHVHRAAAQSWVCRNAPRVLAGEPLELGTLNDFRWFEVDSVDDCASVVRQISTMPEYKGIQILTPQRTTAAGVTNLNTVMQAELNPPGDDKPEWKLAESILRLGDRVIQTVNNYDLDVRNGEVGTVIRFEPPAPGAEAMMIVDFGDRHLGYRKHAAQQLDLAYALTIHKTQGSEFPWVAVVVHSAHTHMLNRALFYTAVTRAKQGVVLIGNAKGIQIATSDKLPPKRNTMLIARMDAERERLQQEDLASATQPDLEEAKATPEFDFDDLDEPDLS